MGLGRSQWGGAEGERSEEAAMSPMLAGVPAWREAAVSDWGGDGATQDLEKKSQVCPGHLLPPVFLPALSSLPPEHHSHVLFLFYMRCHSYTKDALMSQMLGDVHDQDVGAGAGDITVDRINSGSALQKQLV